MIFTRIRKSVVIAAALAGLACCCGFSVAAQAADESRPAATATRKVQLIAGKSTILHSPVAVKRVAVGSDKIADFVMLSPQDIYITAKSAGTTNMTLWSENILVAVYDLEVTFDLSLLKQELNTILPEEKELRVTATNNTVTLSGRVTCAENLAKALALAKTFAPEEKINNLAEVGGVHQVMLEVRVAEMSRSTSKRFGINFNFLSPDGFGFSMLGGLSSIEFKENGSSLLTYSPTVNALFGFNNGNTTWTGLVDALKEDGLAKVLAEPSLITLSGQEASFLAGGEFPIPVPDDDGITIDYKEYGVKLRFTPVVLGAERINIKVTPEVSELDFSTAVQILGYVAPGLTIRKTTTTIELKDGQSFAIAGLLRENVTTDIQKFPVLGDIPVLGALFRSEQFRKQETELIIVVTPKLVKPLDTARQSLPTDFYVEPSDWGFYLNGQLEGLGGKAKPAGLKGRFDGEVGHALPEMKAAGSKKN